MYASINRIFIIEGKYGFFTDITSPNISFATYNMFEYSPGVEIKNITP